jgi:WD40 repeat protein
MKKKLFYLGLAIAFYFSLFTTPCFAQGDTAWIHNTGKNKICCVRISPDGQYVAAGMENGTVILFDAETGDSIRIFPNIIKYPNLCFFPDGKWLGCGGLDSKLYIWDVASGTLLRTLTFPNSNQIRSVDISPDGRYLLGASDKLELWDLDNDSLILTTSSWFYAKFSPNGKYFAKSISNSNGTNIYIYSLDSLKLYAVIFNSQLQMSDMAVSPIAWSSTGDTLAVASGDSLVYFINVPQKSFIGTLNLTYGDFPIKVIRYFNNYIITGGGGFFEYSTGIYNVNNKNRVKGYANKAVDLDIDSIGSYIVLSSGDEITSTYCLVMLHSNNFFSSIFEMPDDENNYFRLYPNPTKDMANLELGSSKAEFYNLGIYDYLGNQMELIYSGFLDAGKHRYTWYPNNYLSGMYFCRIDNGKRVRVIKFVKL